MIVMSKKKETDTLPDIIKAEELELEFPKNKYLEKKETDRIESAILKSGIVTKDGNCFIGLTQLPKLIASDKVAAARTYNNADEKYKLEDSTKKFLGLPEIQKEITKRLQEPRSALDREKLNHSEECLKTFRENETLNKKRVIESDRITKGRLTIGAEKIKNEKIKECQLSGEKFNGNAEAHHIERVADEPNKALDTKNLIVTTDKIHKKIHKENAETPEELKKFIDEKGYSTPKNLEEILKKKKNKSTNF